MLHWAPGFQMYPGLWDRDELVANPAAWPQGCCHRAEIPRYWHHNTNSMPGSQVMQQDGRRGTRAAPKHKIPFNLQTFIQASSLPTPEASEESSWEQKVKTSPRPSTKTRRKARACPIPFHTNRLASGAKSHKGHALARHIPPGPPCPHTQRCQLEQKTHPQVAIWSHAGLGPSADDRLSALLRPACCAAVGVRGGRANSNCLWPLPYLSLPFSILGGGINFLSQAPRVKDTWLGKGTLHLGQEPRER